MVSDFLFSVSFHTNRRPILFDMHRSGLPHAFIRANHFRFDVKYVYVNVHFGVCLKIGPRFDTEYRFKTVLSLSTNKTIVFYHIYVGRSPMSAIHEFLCNQRDSNFGFLIWFGQAMTHSHKNYILSIEPISITAALRFLFMQLYRCECNKNSSK